MMRLTVQRFKFLDKCTIGKLLIDGEDTGIYTLEPKVRSIKVFGKTAIPSGVYKVVMDFSPHFKRILPHILDVPNFEGVRIHPGNTDADTEGCIILGKTWDGGDLIGKSVEAFDFIFPEIKDEVDLEIEVV